MVALTMKNTMSLTTLRTHDIMDALSTINKDGQLPVRVISGDSIKTTTLSKVGWYISRGYKIATDVQLEVTNRWLYNNLREVALYAVPSDDVIAKWQREESIKDAADNLLLDSAVWS